MHGRPSAIKQVKHSCHQIDEQVRLEAEAAAKRKEEEGTGEETEDEDGEEDEDTEEDEDEESEDSDGDVDAHKGQAPQNFKRLLLAQAPGMEKPLTSAD